nr:hypothetical protein Iba_chr02aCG12350 [Ipomoea batatas]GMC68339.1 hypothetical protein Iba_chr02fCG10920 [Ipomoea batatas]
MIQKSNKGNLHLIYSLQQPIDLRMGQLFPTKFLFLRMLLQVFLRLRMLACQWLWFLTPGWIALIMELLIRFLVLYWILTQVIGDCLHLMIHLANHSFQLNINFTSFQD